MLSVTVTIEYDVSDLETHNDAMQIIGTTLPYMTDNVMIRSHINEERY